MEAVLSAENLTKRFGANDVLRGLSFAVAPGEVFGLIGPDGAGKTTALRCLSGLVRFNSGTVRVFGLPLPDARRAVAQKMGYMPQQYSLYGDLSVAENIRFFAGMYGVHGAEREKREKRLLEMALLERFRERPARALSGGMYKKLALCCALLHKPRLILLDEPTNGVDPISRRELWAFLYELLGEGVSVVVSTPYMDEAERCARVGLIQDGRLLRVAAPRELLGAFCETVFELRMEPLPDIAALLKRYDDLSAMYQVGRAVHVLSPKGPEFAAELAARFAAEGCAVSAIEVQSASFEDVFLHLTSRAEGDGSAA